MAAVSAIELPGHVSLMVKMHSNLEKDTVSTSKTDICINIQKRICLLFGAIVLSGEPHLYFWPEQDVALFTPRILDLGYAGTCIAPWNYPMPTVPRQAAAVADMLDRKKSSA